MKVFFKFCQIFSQKFTIKAQVYFEIVRCSAGYAIDDLAKMNLLVGESRTFESNSAIQWIYIRQLMYGYLFISQRARPV